MAPWLATPTRIDAPSIEQELADRPFHTVFPDRRSIQCDASTALVSILPLQRFQNSTASDMLQELDVWLNERPPALSSARQVRVTWSS